jgi:hypothetical protein
MKQNLLWLRHFETIEELRQALLEFREIYNTKWLIERHGYLTPAGFRQKQLQSAANAAWGSSRCPKNRRRYNRWQFGDYRTLLVDPTNPTQMGLKLPALSPGRSRVYWLRHRSMLIHSTAITHSRWPDRPVPEAPTATTGRELLVRQRTMLANALRGHLAEFGLIAAQACTRSRADCGRQE